MLIDKLHIGGTGCDKSEPPILQLSDGRLKVILCLPDAQEGYYRGTRFDWHGVIRDLQWNSHRYFGEWFESHNPYKHDGICGPVDEFSQIGYENAEVGEEFLKIGIGTLRKTDDAPYDRFKLYPIAKEGKQSISSTKRSVQFSQLLVSEKYGYDYQKSITLNEDAAEMRIDYQLKNLGPEPIIGFVYNHNFLTIDKMVTGINTEICFKFPPQGTWRESYQQVALSEDGIVFSRDLNPGESVFMGNLHGHNAIDNGYQFSVANRQTGAGVHVSSINAPLSHIVFWACASTPCIEPYTAIRLYPGEMKTWSLKYHFFVK